MSFRTGDGTAKTSDDDYVAKTGTLTFAPGETTKTITVEVKGDNKKEANVTFYLDLFGNSVTVKVNRVVWPFLPSDLVTGAKVNVPVLAMSSRSLGVARAAPR